MGETAGRPSLDLWTMHIRSLHRTGSIISRTPSPVQIADGVSSMLAVGTFKDYEWLHKRMLDSSGCEHNYRYIQAAQIYFSRPSVIVTSRKHSRETRESLTRRSGCFCQPKLPRPISTMSWRNQTFPASEPLFYVCLQAPSLGLQYIKLAYALPTIYSVEVL